MGYYIETPEDTRKAAQIVKFHGGEIIPKPDAFTVIAPDKALIVVMNNVLFEAAGLAYDKDEFEAFTDPSDARSKQYVILDKALAHKLAKYKEKVCE